MATIGQTHAESIMSDTAAVTNSGQDSTQLMRIGRFERIAQQLGAACGILYMVLALFAVNVLNGGLLPDANAPLAEIAAHLAQHRPTPMQWAGIYIELIALLLFVVFVCNLWGVLRRAEGDPGWLSAIVLSAGVLTVAVKIASFSGPIAVVYRVGVDPQLARTLIDMNDASFVITWATDALLVAATAIVVLRTGVMRRWLGWLGIVTSVALLVDVALNNSFSQLLFLIWIVSTSIVLVRRAQQLRSILTNEHVTS